jgi:hypothetical protein
VLELSEKVNAKVEMNCTEGRNGEISCRISASENGKHASCDLSVAEVKNGASFKLNCSGDKELFQKIENSDMFVHKNDKDFHLNAEK